MRLSAADLVRQLACSLAYVPRRKVSPVPITKTQEYRNAEISKINGRGKVRRNPEKRQAGPDG
jgi:hypothetical protein